MKKQVPTRPVIIEIRYKNAKPHQMHFATLPEALKWMGKYMWAGVAEIALVDNGAPQWVSK